VRYTGNFSAVAKEVQEAIHKINHNLPITNVTTMDVQVASSYTNQTIIAELSAFFGVVAVFLSWIGRCLWPGNKLTAEDTTEHLDGKKEGRAGGDPVGVVWSESAGSKHTVNMGMMLQSLVPGMEHAEETDHCAEVPGIASDLKQSLSAGLKQQVINHLLVLQRERSKLARQREDDMHVGRRQKLSFTRLQPVLARVALALGTVPIAARVVGDGGMSAV
jgi:hypothetical protein